MTGPVPASTAPAHTRLWEFGRALVNAQVPVGSYEMGPGGWTLNDLLVPFTDSRSDDRLLPETASLADVYGAMVASLPGLAPGAVNKRHAEALMGQTAEGQPVEGFSRLLDLFPAAGAEGGGAIAPAVRPGSTTLGTYAGRLSRTADLDALARAEKLAAGLTDAERARMWELEGMDVGRWTPEQRAEYEGLSNKADYSFNPDRIRQETGWFRDPAGDWKYEIPDENAEYRPGRYVRQLRDQGYTGDPAKTGFGGTLADVFDHPELYAAYPELAGRPFYVDPDLAGGPGQGSFGGKFGYNALSLNPDIAFRLDEGKGVTLHETQHAIQDIEKTARGGNPQGMRQPREEALEALDDLKAWRTIRPYLDEAGGDLHTAQELINDRAGLNVPLTRYRLRSLQEQFGGMTDDQLAALETKHRPYAAAKDDFDAYQRLLGEVEARDAQYRRSYTPEQRQAFPPYESQGIAPDDMIIQKSRFTLGKGNTLAAERDIPHGLDVPPEVPGNAAATPSGQHPMIGETFTDQFAAMKVWKEAGGKNGPIKITGLPEGARIPTSWRIDPNEAAGAGAVPAATGGHGLVGHGSNLPGSQPVSAKDSVDRRGMPGRDPLGPRTPLGVTDPEGRPLYQEALIAGIRSPGGPDVPLSMPEEVRLAEGLAQLETPRGGILGANGQVLVAQPGTVDPPGRPLLHMKVDADLPDSQYMKSFRHEGGHAIDYTTERTERGFESSKQYAVPADVRAELQAASADMRPELWAPNANEIYQRPTASLKEYRERPDELMADNYRYYKEDPAGYKAKYPEAAKYIRAMVNDDPLLSGQVQFNVRGGLPPLPPPDDVQGDAARAAQQSWIVRHLMGGGA